MSDLNTTNPATLALHAGYRADPATNAVAVPIYQTTSYQFGSAEQAANLFGLGELGNIYTRIMNSTTDVLEQRLTALEGGARLSPFHRSDGRAYAIQNLVSAGDNIVSSTDLYGAHGTCSKTPWRSRGSRCGLSIRPTRRLLQKPAIPAPVPIMPKPCQTRSWRCFRLARSPKSAVNAAFR